MKILVPTSVKPNKKSLRVNYINSILDALRIKNPTQIIWLVYEPNKVVLSEDCNTKIVDIHNFSNAIDCLKKLKPDCVMVGKDVEPIQFSLSLAAKYLKIPLISFYYQSFETDETRTLEKFDQLIAYSRIISSNAMPTDSNKEVQFLRRLRFIIFKLGFLYNTKKFVSTLNSNKVIFILKELINYLQVKEVAINTLPDLHLLRDSSWSEQLKLLGVSKENISIVGNPLLDNLFEKSNKNLSPSGNEKISILIVTDALVEHGIWTRRQMKSFLKNIIKELKNQKKNLFAIKIHPSSESKQFYEKLLNESRSTAKIYQHENFWDIIKNYDLVLSFGTSTIHTEISLIGVKMIFLDFNFNFPLREFVKEGIEAGNIIKCTDISLLNGFIEKLSKVDLKNSETFHRIRQKFLFDFDGKSSFRASEAILQILKNKRLS